VSPLSPMYRATRPTANLHESSTRHSHHPEAEGLMSGSYDHTELCGEAAPSISELSPNAERSPINTPRRAVVPASDDVGAAHSQGTEPLMRPNLYQSEGPANNGAVASHKKHVMSWTDYDEAMPGPVR